MHRDSRIQAIHAALRRYEEAGWKRPIAWLEELDILIKEAQNE